MIAPKVGVDKATVGRWRTGAVDPKPRQVVAYARAYGLNPISALIAAGFLSAQELDIEVSIPITTLADYSVTELAEELASRLRQGANGGSIAALFPTTTDIGNDKTHVIVAPEPDPPQSQSKTER